MLPVALDQTYDYLVEVGAEAPLPGSFVMVPFGRQSRIGIVWSHSVGDGKPVAAAKMKTIDGVLEMPALPPITLQFCEWIAKYTLSPLGMVARMMMSAPAAFEPVKPRFGVTVVPGAPPLPRMTPERIKALEIASDGRVRAKSALAAEAQCSSAVINGLIAAGQLAEVAIPEKRFPKPDHAHHVASFGDHQEPAVHVLRAAVDAAGFSATLLDGVTGSGKTEVYFEAVARALAAGRQVLIMLPEIALTSQFMGRFAKRFGCAPVEWHSALAPPERGRICAASRPAMHASSSVRGRHCSSRIPT